MAKTITLRLDDKKYKLIKKHAENIIEEADRIKKVQELNLAVESIEPYMKK